MPRLPILTGFLLQEDGVSGTGNAALKSHVAMEREFCLGLKPLDSCDALGGLTQNGSDLLRHPVWVGHDGSLLGDLYLGVDDSCSAKQHRGSDGLLLLLSIHTCLFHPQPYLIQSKNREFLFWQAV